MRSIIPNTITSAHCHYQLANENASSERTAATTKRMGSKHSKRGIMCKWGYFCLRAAFCEVMMARDVHDTGDPDNWDLGLRVWYWFLFSIVEVMIILILKLKQKYQSDEWNSIQFDSTDASNKDISKMTTVESPSETFGCSPLEATKDFSSRPIQSKTVPVTPESLAGSSFDGHSSVVDKRSIRVMESQFIPEYPTTSSAEIGYDNRATEDPDKISSTLPQRQRLVSIESVQDEKENTLEAARFTEQNPKKRKRDPEQFHFKGAVSSVAEIQDIVNTSTMERTTSFEIPNSWKRKREVKPVNTNNGSLSFVNVTQVIGRKNNGVQSTASSRRTCVEKKKPTKSNAHNSACKNLSRWEAKFRLLLEYQKQFHTTRVPQHSTRHKALSVWVKSQRQRYSKGKVPQDRIDLLESIGFEWDPGKQEWMKKYERLVAYKHAHGTTRVPQGWKTDPQLARWVKNQRHKCKMQYRIDLLNEIDFAWKA